MAAYPNPSVDRPRLRPLEDAERRQAIIEAISNYELSMSSAWSDLDELSSHTIVEEFEANPDGIFETADDGFEAEATVYVTLNYGSRRDAASMTDSFPAHVRGHVNDEGGVVIENVEVDTSSFFE